MGFDLQGGGSDLAFPHHEMCSAQAGIATGETPFAKHFVHAGMVGYEGHKMSKSRGNLVFVSRLRHAGVSSAAVRLALLAHHYRSDWEWTPEDLERAEHRERALRDGVRAEGGPAFDAVLAAVRERIADDLDTPGALRLLDQWASEAAGGVGPDRDAPERVRVLLDTLLGVDLS